MHYLFEKICEIYRPLDNLENYLEHRWPNSFGLIFFGMMVLLLGVLPILLDPIIPSGVCTLAIILILAPYGLIRSIRYFFIKEDSYKDKRE
ncbi:MAG: hypothetical protein CMM52_15940 [Rhodospirillaceae bacterium]|nr:hypothetical protein [Rhodospirillaceae bacterium]